MPWATIAFAWARVAFALGFYLWILRLLVPSDTDVCLCSGLVPHTFATAFLHDMILHFNNVREDMLVLCM
jgi:hypothetical protein